MREVFLDTSYIVALEAADEQYHVAAREHWRGFALDLPNIVTTSYVFGEVVTLFNSRQRHARAVEVGNRLLASSSVEVVQVDEDLFREAWEYFCSRKDKRYSLADCISFVLMQRRGIHEALSFDSDFEQAGFRMLPDRRLAPSR